MGRLNLLERRVARFLKEPPSIREAAGVIVFGKNAPDAGSVRALTGSLQRSARGGAIVSTDQEGGAIRSLAFAPPESSQASLSTPAAARESATAAASSMTGC